MIKAGYDLYHYNTITNSDANVPIHDLMCFIVPARDLLLRFLPTACVMAYIRSGESY
jgi:hypothetical protein